MDINKLALETLEDMYRQVGRLVKKKYGRAGHLQVKKCNAILRDIEDPEIWAKTLIRFHQAFCDLLDSKMPDTLNEDERADGLEKYNLRNRTENRAKYLADYMEKNELRVLSSKEATAILQTVEGSKLHPMSIHRALELIPEFLDATVSKANNGVKRIIAKKDAFMSTANHFLKRETPHATLRERTYS